MQRWRHFQTTALLPAFRELRANNIYASIQSIIQKLGLVM
jgi:hypothetical protein